jgi:hypothetical protein
LSFYTAQFETLMRSQECDSTQRSAQTQENATDITTPTESNTEMANISALPDDRAASISSLAGTFGQSQPTQAYLPGAGLYHSDRCNWDMISLGLEEPLPSPDIIDELYVSSISIDKGTISLLTQCQSSNILQRDPPVDSHHSLAAVHDGLESCSSYATSSLSAIYNLGSCSSSN